MQAVISNEYDIGLQETTDGFFRAYCLFKKLFIYLALQVLSLSIQDLSCGKWNLLIVPLTRDGTSALCTGIGKS